MLLKFGVALHPQGLLAKDMHAVVRACALFENRLGVTKNAVWGRNTSSGKRLDKGGAGRSRRVCMRS